MKSKIFVCLFFARLLSACVTPSDDYLVKGEHREVIDLGNVTEVVVRCFCPNFSIKRNENSSQLIVVTKGQEGSSGYHGEQAKPSSIEKNQLTFSVRKSGERLTLESREYTFMHHFGYLTDVNITAPSRLAIRYENVTYKELYDRKISNDN